MWLVDRLDSKRPEPSWTLRRVAILGGLATIPCILIQLALERMLNPGGYWGALFTAFISAGIVEETAKALTLYFAVWRHPDFDERFDGIVYAARAGLGFALVENVGYLAGSETMVGFVGVFVLRAALAVPGHAIYAGFMGYWAARRRFDNHGPGLLGGLLIAILLHGTYDAALFLIGVLSQAGTIVSLLILPLIAVPFVVVVFGYRRLMKHGEEAIALDDLTHAPRPPHPPWSGLELLVRAETARHPGGHPLG
jgi:RsiW-degrading membrane proteinase PrsW (M82 family)